MADNENIILYEFAAEEFPGQIKAALGELYPLFEQRNLIKINVATGRLSLDYSGFAASGTKLVTVLPKYLRTQISNILDPAAKIKRTEGEAGKLYRLLKRNEYGLAGKKNIEVAAADFINENSAGYTNELAVADFILNDYQDNGLWSYTEKKILINAGGETDWELTVNNTDPVVVAGRPYYFETYSSADERISDSVITQIHKYAVNYCNRRYGFILDLELATLPDAAEDIDDLGDSYALLYALEKQLRITFREREILLLKALAELLEIGFSQSDESISLYGRRDFEQVWEAALQYCFNHDANLRKTLFPLPEWFDVLTDEFLAVNINDTLKPDILRKISQNGQELLLVLDAKYYLLNFSNKSSFPPVGDIVKQYFYEAAVTRSVLGYKPEDIVNAFIFPSQAQLSSNWFQTAGHSTFDNDLFGMATTTGQIKKPLVSFVIDPDAIFERYTRFKILTDEELLNFIKSWQSYMDNPLPEKS
ncbi:MAG: LlaJI family restriction endonuclease [Chryseobacterium sp.]|nr:MAG: LlaJI family restriction endonuclease [Chryseobacterium sp.]